MIFVVISRHANFIKIKTTKVAELKATLVAKATKVAELPATIVAKKAENTNQLFTHPTESKNSITISNNSKCLEKVQGLPKRLII
jgi:hypothetical protein